MLVFSFAIYIRKDPGLHIIGGNASPNEMLPKDRNLVIMHGLSSIKVTIFHIRPLIACGVFLVIFYALELDTMVMYHITDWCIS